MKSMLTNREVDLILSTDPASVSSSIYKWVPLMSCEVLVVLPADHPLAQEDRYLYKHLSRNTLFATILA